MSSLKTANEGLAAAATAVATGTSFATETSTHESILLSKQSYSHS
jgi:hypothetical protein